MKDQNTLVVKDNALTRASYSLSVVEHRLVLMAISMVNDKTFDPMKPIEIYAGDFAKLYKVKRDTAYEALQGASKTLFERRFSYKKLTEKGNVQNVTSRWVSAIYYTENEGTIALTFSQEVIPLITHLSEHFTRYELKQTRSLSTVVAIRLYEIASSWQNWGRKVTFSVNEVKEFLGMPPTTYASFSDFKKKALEPAIKKINTTTNLTIEFSCKMQGKKPVSIEFEVMEKPEMKIVKEESHISKEIKYFYKLSQKQLDIYSDKLSQNAEVQRLANTGEEMPAFVRRIKTMLASKSDQEKLIEGLVALGFDFKAVSKEVI